MISIIVFAILILTCLGLLLVLINKLSNNFLSSKIKAIVIKTKQISIKIHDKWYFWPILFILIYVVNLIIYLIFTNSLGDPGVILYGDGVNYSEVAKIARSFVSKLNYAPITIFGIVLTLVVIIYFIVNLKKKKLTYLHSIILVLILGSILRIIYGNVTDNIFTRQHDVWSSGGYGHYQITMHIYETFSLPMLKNGQLSSSYQMYHPKFVHYTHAIFMHINSLFIKGEASWYLYQSIRIFSITISIFTMVLSYLIIKELFKERKSQLIAITFFTFSPIMIRFTASSNNDALLFFFITSTILFLIKFIKKQSYKNIIFIAVSIGLAMASKLSGALIAVPTAVVFVIFFIKFTKEKQFKNILLFVVFAAICFPLALFWPIYNYINYGQPLTYVFSNLNQALAVPPTSYVDRFIIFDFNQYFNSLYMQLWANGNVPQITNLYAAMLKSKIFGEFSYVGIASGFGVVLYAANILLMALLTLGGVYFLIKLVRNRNFNLIIAISFPIVSYISFVFIYSKATPLIVLGIGLIAIYIFFIIKYLKNFKNIFISAKYELLFSLIFLVFMVSYFTFQIQYPYTCTLDYRYVAIFSLVGGYFVTRFINGSTNKAINIPIYVVLGIYLVSSYFMYIFVGI